MSVWRRWKRAWNSDPNVHGVIAKEGLRDVFFDPSKRLELFERSGPLED
jgi:hypothetical protein